MCCIFLTLHVKIQLVVLVNGHGRFSPFSHGGVLMFVETRRPDAVCEQRIISPDADANRRMHPSPE